MHEKLTQRIGESGAAISTSQASSCAIGCAMLFLT